MKTTFVTVLKFLIGWPLAILAIYYIYTIIAPNAGEILPRLLTIHISFLLLGMICFVIFYTLRGYVWHEILHYYSYNFPFRETLFLWEFSELKRYIPGNIWSFLGRSVLFRQRGVTKQHLATSFVVEAQLLVLSAMILSILAVPYALSLYHIPDRLLVDVAVILAVIFFCLFFAGNTYILSLSDAKIVRLLRKVLPPFSPGKNLRLLTIDLVALLFYGMGNFLVISSLFALPSGLFLVFSGYFVLALLIGYLSIIAPTGLGVREGVVILLLKNFTQTSFAGFLALFSRIILIVSEVIFLSFAYMIHKRKFFVKKDTAI